MATFPLSLLHLHSIAAYGPDMAHHVSMDAVREAIVCVGEGRPVRQPLQIRGKVEGIYSGGASHVGRAAGVSDVQRSQVGRVLEAIGNVEGVFARGLSRDKRRHVLRSLRLSAHGILTHFMTAGRSRSHGACGSASEDCHGDWRWVRWEHERHGVFGRTRHSRRVNWHYSHVTFPSRTTPVNSYRPPQRLSQPPMAPTSPS
jgi:hypothetical protein